MADRGTLSEEAYFGERYIDTDNAFVDLIDFVNEVFDGANQQENMLNKLFFLRESNYQAHLVWYKDHPETIDLEQQLKELRNNIDKEAAKKWQEGVGTKDEKVVVTTKNNDDMSSLTNPEIINVDDWKSDDDTSPTFITQSLTQIGFVSPSMSAKKPVAKKARRIKSKSKDGFKQSILCKRKGSTDDSVHVRIVPFYDFSKDDDDSKPTSETLLGSP